MGTTRQFGSSPGDVAGILFGIAILGVLLAVPADATQSIEPVDTEPVDPVIETLVASRDTLFVSQSSELVCIASHDHNASLTYTWSSAYGRLIPMKHKALWQAPANPGTYAVKVEVEDSDGGSASAVTIVQVRDNAPPAITSLSADPAVLLPGQISTLRCEASDPDGHTISYEWQCSAGVISGLGPMVTLTAPEEPGTLSATVRVTDELGASRTRTVTVDVLPADPPIIEDLLVWPLLPDYTKEDFRGGYRLLRGSLTQCEIECVAYAAGRELTYEWSCTEGTIEGAGPMVLFTPPNATTEVYVKVTVSDVFGQAAEEELLFRIFQREEYSREIERSSGGCVVCLRR